MVIEKRYPMNFDYARECEIMHAKVDCVFKDLCEEAERHGLDHATETAYQKWTPLNKLEYCHKLGRQINTVKETDRKNQEFEYVQKFKAEFDDLCDLMDLPKLKYKP